MTISVLLPKVRSMQINTLKSCQDANYDNVAVPKNKLLLTMPFGAVWTERIIVP